MKQMEFTMEVTLLLITADLDAEIQTEKAGNEAGKSTFRKNL